MRREDLAAARRRPTGAKRGNLREAVLRVGGAESERRVGAQEEGIELLDSEAWRNVQVCRKVPTPSAIDGAVPIAISRFFSSSSCACVICIARIGAISHGGRPASPAASASAVDMPDAPTACAFACAARAARAAAASARP